MEGGKQYQQLVGSRRQVFNGTAKKTGYGKAALTKKHLKMNKHGRIVSVKKSRASRKNKNLGKFLQKRGSKTFGPVLAKKKGGREITDDDREKAREAGEKAYNDEIMERCGLDYSHEECEDNKKIKASSAQTSAENSYIAEIQKEPEEAAPAEAQAAPAEAQAQAAEGGKKKAKKSKK